MSLPLALVWLALLDLAWLEYVRAGLAPGCGPASACVEVTSGPYSQLLGAPWTWWGLGFYAVMAVLLLVQSRWSRPLSWLGLLASTALMGVQFAVIHQICPFCLVSAVLSLVLTGTLHQGVPVPRRPGVAGFLTVLLIGLALRAAWRDHVTFDPPTPEVSASARHWRGSPTAPVRLVMFLSLTCPHCANQLHRLVEFQASHPDEVSLALRHLPPDCPSGAGCRGAVKAEAAPDFWETFLTLEQLFAAQRSGQVSAQTLERYLQPPAASLHVNEDRALAARLNIITVPVVFVNDRRLRGPVSDATLRRLLNTTARQ